ncbi:12618_t:CDS:2 [Ambispora leptoticha]|uniref:12618_t:CDS:1 n=1 Tax=Ambispora leptoticha TaxID=144679 RepID=A0A9N9ABP5_9GLOM|nr:12618_t:CDS:2 [Ambispora leptoticha]
MVFMNIFWMWFRTVTLNERLISAIKRLLSEYNKKERDTGITWEYGNSCNEKPSNWVIKESFDIDFF